MIELQPIGWWNTGVPLLLLLGLAVGLPRLLVRRATRSQSELAVAVWASAGVLLIAGALIFAVLYGGLGVAVWPSFTSAPLAVVGFFFRLSGFAALIWAPILVLVWYVMAQGVEKRKGEDVARGGE